MGLRFPRDLARWQRWQRSQVPLVKRVKQRLQPGAAPTMLLESPKSPSILVALDSWSPTSALALQAPLEHLPADEVAVLHPGSRSALPALKATVLDGGREVPRVLRHVQVVVALGHYLPYGNLAHEWARSLGARFVVVQHGALTPWMAPLPEDAVLLAWSAEDAAFWAESRGDVEQRVVGSELLARAGARRIAHDPAEAPIFLGQLHGAELPRHDFARAAEFICRTAGAHYRPHPSEKDLLSRWQHRRWERRGITIDRSDTPLAQIDRPVVGVFSTGVLEAAARGIPAWVHHPDPPEWLVDFWSRYRMGRWRESPTPAPAVPTTDPAARVATTLQELIP
ncbi:RNA-binding protein [Ornithinimicrobium sp. Y1847]|uniref:RNA-binding protein n=1 Tax=Ornithinimicrobium sp. Y1847 TaxID=3405419 RepID=UPI003B6820CD